MEPVKVVMISEEDFLDKAMILTEKLLDDYEKKADGDIGGLMALLMMSAMFTGEFRKELFKEPTDGEEK